MINPMTLENPDAVERIAEQWALERPELDVAPMLVVGRLHRVADLLDQELRTVFAQADLGNGDFDVLASLRRAGAPYRLTPTELAGTTMVTSGAVTKRVDRLAERGLVTRRVGEHDARGRVVALTDAGRELIDRAFDAHMANEHRLVASLGEIDRTRLARLLEEWGRALGAD
jgi:DNA-binding MarR family transcriptional regulator